MFRKETLVKPWINLTYFKTVIIGHFGLLLFYTAAMYKISDWSSREIQSDYKWIKSSFFRVQKQNSNRFHFILLLTFFPLTLCFKGKLRAEATFRLFCMLLMMMIMVMIMINIYNYDGV